MRAVAEGLNLADMPGVQDNIGDLLRAVRDYIGEGLSGFGPDGRRVVLGNIALADGNGTPGNGQPDGMGEATVLTVVRLVEDPSRKNQASFRYVDPTDRSAGYLPQHPPVRLDLEVLVTANYREYGDALDVLSRVIALFQYRPVFGDGDPWWPDDPRGDFDEERFTASLIPLNFEQQNHLWSSLGGRQRPAVLYRLQTADLAYLPDAQAQGPPIESYDVNLSPITP